MFQASMPPELPSYRKEVGGSPGTSREPSMIAPQYAQAMLLHKVIEEAVHLLSEPIDKVEVVGRTVVVRAGGKRLTMNYSMWHGDTLGTWGWDITRREEKPLTLCERLRTIVRKSVGVRK